MNTPDQHHFFLARQGTAHGPLSWTEIQSYLAYGSVRPTDLLSVDGRGDWRRLDDWREEVEAARAQDVDDQEPPRGFRRIGWFVSSIVRALKRDETKTEVPRRRAVRFREWEHVPKAQRSSSVLWSLVVGFFFFPPRLWATTSRVFAQHIFRPVSDDAGFLKIWPRSADTVCALLVVVNIAWWIVLTVLFQQHVLPILRIAIETVKETSGS